MRIIELVNFGHLAQVCAIWPHLLSLEVLCLLGGAVIAILGVTLGKHIEHLLGAKERYYDDVLKDIEEREWQELVLRYGDEPFRVPDGEPWSWDLGNQIPEEEEEEEDVEVMEFNDLDIEDMALVAKEISWVQKNHEKLAALKVREEANLRVSQMSVEEFEIYLELLYEKAYETMSMGLMVKETEDYFRRTSKY